MVSVLKTKKQKNTYLLFTKEINFAFLNVKVVLQYMYYP